MAQFLNLPSLKKYTGHAVRRSCASIKQPAKKAFNWKPESTSMRYVETTESGKCTIADMLTPSEPENGEG